MRPAPLITAVLILLATSSNAYSQAPAVTVQSENDGYRSFDDDDDYTNGLRISLDFSRAVLWGHLFSSLQDCSTAPEGSTAPCRKTTLFVGQNFYSPHDITVPEVQPTERPYSAWLYIGLAARAAQRRRLRTMEIQLGTTGKNAFGKEVQTWWHLRLCKCAPEPRGWQHQVKPVPGVVGVIASWDDRIARERRTRGPRPFVFADVVPYYRVSLGNVFDQGAGGAVARFGYNLQRRWVEKISPTVPPSVASLQPTVVSRERNFEFNLIGALEGRAVAWNALLQHDTHTPKPPLSINRGVVDVETGVALGYRRVSGGFRWIWRSPEFDGGRWSRFAGLFVTFGR
jgi:lipid A 3-O-deacylase